MPSRDKVDLYRSSSDPTVDNDEDTGYGVGNFWVNTSTGEMWSCKDSSSGAAVWNKVGNSPYPDTKPFQGIWASVSTVTFEERPGQSTTVRLTLQDGKQRYVDVSTPLTWSEANGVADLGYDEAGSQGNDKWKYFYAIPKSGDDSQLSIRASDNPPSTGPAGYSNWKYIWCTYDASGDLINVIQSGNVFTYNNITESLVYGGSDAGYIEHETSFGSVDASSKAPPTTINVQWEDYVALTDSEVSYWTIRWSLDGTNVISQSNARGNGVAQAVVRRQTIIPLNSNQTIYRKRQRISGTADLVYIHYGPIAWTDGWIDP